MEVKIKKLHKDAVIPKYAKPGDAGLDLTAIDRKLVREESGVEYIEYDTGLAIEIPDGHVGLIFPRSSLCSKDLILSNHVGVIDSGYRGSIKAKFKVDLPYDEITELLNRTFTYIDNGVSYDCQVYAVGERCMQLITLPYPQIEFIEVDELSSTERGSGGYGSTNK